MPKVTDAHRAARRDEIIDAALRCFSERGIQRTSMADIIDASGLSAGAIYGHFAGKKELFAATAERVLSARTAEVEDLRHAGVVPSPGELMATVLRGIDREPFSHVIVQLWGDAAADPEIRALVQGVFARLRGMIEANLLAWAVANPDRIEGSAEAWARSVAPAVLGLGPGFLLQRAVIDDFDAEGYIRAVTSLLPR
ncbi:TetR/AcrR family transcriptional regulator [Agromyces salentinus]|uniref:HTH tetR-type domain-containing protein n=1 Tax=Agromyces salentinus TaxID=269421 RepID=A0ABN2MTD0_9MICO|nr:TetR/AcrR family transcriptional regulator [Agromyces salentinus]